MYTDLFKPEATFYRDKLLDQMRENDPIYWMENPAMNAWIVTEYDAINSLLKDSRTQPGVTAACIQNAPQKEQEALADLTQLIGYRFGNLTKDRFNVVRGAMMEFFAPTVIENYRTRIETITNQLINSIVEESEDIPIDLIKKFSYPLPVMVITEILGVPYEDRHLFLEWSQGLLGIYRPYDFPTYCHAQISWRAMVNYCGEIMDAKMKAPSDDLLSELGKRVSTGELERYEALVNCASLLLAGHETSAVMITKSVKALHESSEQLAALRADLSLAPQFVKEILRHSGVAIWLKRTANDDIEISNQKINKGDLICLGLHAANHDPKYFTNPHQLNISRTMDKSPLPFSTGYNRCLGSHLAELEIEIAVTALLKRFHNIEVMWDEIKERPTYMLNRAIDYFPLKLYANTPNYCIA